MIKVLIDCERLKYPNTGLYTFCKDLGTALLDQKNNEIDYTFYIPKNSKAPFNQNSSYKKNHPLHKIYIPNTSEYDIWHTTCQNSKYKPYNTTTKIVYTIHDLNFLIEKKDRPKKIQSLLKNIQKDIDKAAAITCISEYVKKDILKHFDLKGKKIHVIHNGVAVKEFPECAPPRFRTKAPFIFSIGTVLPKKNFHVLPCLLSNNQYELIIAGNLSSPEYINQIKNEALKHNVADRVHIIGSITDAEKYWYYKHCESFVFPSLAEGFGLPAIEAMHFKKPVFLSNETSLPEIGGTAAYYFDSFDSKTMITNFNDGMAHYTKANNHNYIQQRAMEFTWKNAALAYQKIYLNL